jgi:hypothetical protein
VRPNAARAEPHGVCHANAVRKRLNDSRNFENMKSKFFPRAATLALASVIAASQAAKAAPEDYEFQLVENEIKEGKGAVVAVKLVDKRTGGQVENAVIFTTRMDMAPDGMEAMTSPVEALPSEQPGIYRFKTDLIMAGGWRFSIAAKVQGEAETVKRRLEFKAVP